jgi:hypothetical protein
MRRAATTFGLLLLVYMTWAWREIIRGWETFDADMGDYH